MDTAKFVYAGKEVTIGKFDPSSPTVIIKKDWDEIQQEIFDQLDDSRVFTKEELEAISLLDDKQGKGAFWTKDFLKCIIEEDEDPNNYNRARAIYEYKIELLSAIKGHRPTAQWAAGLDALRLGAVAEDYNY